MNRRALFFGVTGVLVAVCIILLAAYLIRRQEPLWLQGQIACTTYRASSKLAGRIDSLWVSEGDWVERGELLYTLTTPELDARLTQVEAIRSAAEALDAATLAGARRQQIEAARNLWQRAEAGLTLAKKSYERVERLYAAGVVPAQQFDEATAEYHAAQAATDAARAEYDLAVAGARREEREAAAAKVTEAQGAVQEVRSYLADARVYAPVSGEVSTILAEAGELVGTGYPVVSILDRNDLWVTFNIKEELLPRIRQGMIFSGYLPALGRSLRWRISSIAPEADFATWRSTRAEGGFDIRTFAVKARPEEADRDLRVGMSVLVNWKELPQ